jgi:hypothetical protein
MNSGNKIKTFWDVVKRKTGKVQPIYEITSININNTESKNLTSFAVSSLDTFSWLLNIFLSLWVQGNSLLYIEETFQSQFPGRNIVQTIAHETKKIIQFLKFKNLSGYSE